MSNQELTERQLEIVRMVATGKTNKEIAYDLGVSQQTVKNHLTTIYRVVGAEHDRRQKLMAAGNAIVPIVAYEILQVMIGVDA